MVIHNDLETFFDGVFPDKRLDKRASQVLDSIIRQGKAVVGQSCTTLCQQIGAYRMLNNAKVTEERLSECVYKRTVEHITDSHVLCIQDTTEFNYNTKMGRIGKDDMGIGPLGNDTNGGFFCHPVLVVNAEQNTPVGFLDIDLWNRHWGKLNKQERNYPSLPIEEKESYRWIKSARESAKRLPEGVMQTVIADRESDIYEFFSQVPDQQTEVLIRSSYNRKLREEELLLHDKMRTLPVAEIYSLEVKGNHKRQNRIAQMELRYDRTDIRKPHDLKGDYPQWIPLYCIYVVEQGQSIPCGEKPIEWCLLTTHRVETIEQAKQCVQWYKCRWHIEEIFRLLKSEGMQIENAQLETSRGLKKLLIFALIAAWRIMSLKQAYDRKDEQNPASVIFSEQQMEFLSILLPSLEGKTQKQKNPYRKGSFIWAAWSIARLGAWNGYQSQAKPGYITFAKGYKVFMDKFDTFKLLENVYRE
jgi:hypothetical protein